MRYSVLTVTFLLIGLPISGRVAHAANIASSTFDADTEGWSIVELSFPTVGPPYTPVNTQSPTWTAAGGNPAGHLVNSANQFSTVYWSAPAAFLGNNSLAYGGELSFDLFDSPTDNQFDQEDIIMTGGGMTVVFDTPTNPTASWTHFQVNLTENGWKLNTLTGPVASQADMQTVLSNLSKLYIRGEFQLGVDTRGIDNVVMTAIPEPSAFLLLALGVLITATARHSNNNARRIQAVVRDN